MCTYQANTDGIALDSHFAHYAQFSLGGAGLIMLEATAVEKRGRISAGDLGLWSDEHIEPLQRLVDFAHAQNSTVGIQLAHAGLKGSTRPPWEGNGYLDTTDESKGSPPWELIGPSSSHILENGPSYKILSINEIKGVIEEWGKAAKRANDAGFDVLEIHGAHGYLISEFLSPLTNSRQDEYGGETGRMKFALEVTRIVRCNWPESKPLFFRLSVIDGVDIGWTIENSVTLAKALKELGVDLIDCSSGGMVIERQYALPRTLGFQVYLAEAIKTQAKVSVASVGLITEAKQAENILRDSDIDLIAIGRAALNDPYWPRHAAQFFEYDEHFEQWPEQYGWWLDRWAKSLKRLINEKITKVV